MKNQEKKKFSPSERKILGNYIYALIDPRDEKDEVFYIGQGHKERLFGHFEDAEKYLKDTRLVRSDKVKKIIAIWKDNLDVKWAILAHKLQTAIDIADAVEAAAIAVLKFNLNGKNKRQNDGNNDTSLTPEKLADMSAKLVDPAKAHPYVYLFSIQKAVNEGKSIGEATKCCWIVAKHRLKETEGAIAIGITDKLSRGVFKIERWDKVGARYKIIGTEIKDRELSNKNFQRIIDNTGYWKRGGYLIVNFLGDGKYKFIKGKENKKTQFRLIPKETD